MIFLIVSVLWDSMKTLYLDAKRSQGESECSEFLKKSASYIWTPERPSQPFQHKGLVKRIEAVLAGYLRMPPEISAKQPTYIRPKQNAALCYLLTTHNNPRHKVKCMLSVFSLFPHLRNELLNDRKETGGRGEEKTLCPYRQTRTESSDFDREYLSRQTTLAFLNQRMFLVLINILIYIQLSVSGFIIYRRGKKREGREAVPVILPKSFNYFEKTFLLPKSEGEHFSLTKQDQLRVVSPVEEEPLQTNQSTKTLEKNKIPLIVSAV